MKRILTIILCLSITAFAVGAELQSFYKSKFSGLNNKVNVRLLQDDESPDMSNFNLDMVGAIKERSLFGQYNTLSGALGSNSVTGLFKFYTTTSKFFIACAGSRICKGVGGVWTDITEAGLSPTSGSFWTSATFNNQIYLFNPSVTPTHWDGASATTTHPGDHPGTNCAYATVHKNRVWAAKSDTLPYRLYFSSLNNAEDWATTGGYADLPDMTQTITGLISWGGYLYVFTETNIFVLLGSTPNDFSLRKTSSMVGAIAPRSIKITDIGMCFLSRSGVYAFDGNNSSRISDKIDTTITGMSKTLIQNACALYDGQKYWLAYSPSGSSYNNRIVIYDIMLKDWYLYQGESCNINYFERAYGGTDKGELYGGSSLNNGFVYQLQPAIGTESTTHETAIDFNNQVTYNSVVSTVPSVVVQNGIDCYTKLAAHFNGPDAGTYSPDETDKVLTYFDNAQLDTAEKVFGSASLLLDGAGDYVTALDSADWDFPADFTVDFRVRLTAVNVTQHLIGNASWANGGLGWLLVFGSDAKLYFKGGWNGANWAIDQNGGSGMSANTWYHIAIVRNGTSLNVYVNGVPAITAVDTPTSLAQVGNLYIGRDSGAASLYMGGQIDEVRISKGVARWSTNFVPPTREYGKSLIYGTLTSQILQIYAAGQVTLDKIVWTGYTPTKTNIAFQTRTGTTSDTVYFNNWQSWSSSSTVNFDTVSDGSVTFTSSDAINLAVRAPSVPQARNILYYETDYSLSPNCVELVSSGAGATNDYVQRTLPVKDLSTTNWITGWIKSPASGNCVELSIGETNYTENTISINTVQVNNWEKWYWYIGGIAPIARDAINKMRVTYKGVAAGNIYVGESWAQNYYESGDVMSSTPNDYIQYRGILGSEDQAVTPELYTVSLIYTPELGVAESSLSSYYYTKWFDFKTPQLNKQFDSMVMEVNSTTSSSVTLYCDYDIDFGTKTGTMSFPITSTANTVRMLKNFPASTYGKSMRLKIYNNDKDATVEVKAAEIRFRQEGVQPN